MKLFLIFLIHLIRTEKYVTYAEAIKKLHDSAQKRVKKYQTQLISKKNGPKPKRDLSGRRPNMNPDLVCDVSARIYPLLFLSAVGNVEFRVALMSTCLHTPVILYFTLPSSKQHFSLTIFYATPSIEQIIIPFSINFKINYSNLHATIASS